MDVQDREPSVGIAGRFRRLPSPVRLSLPYLLSLISLAVPAAISAALLHHPELTPLYRFAFALDVAVVSWWAGFWAGILVTAAATPVLLLVVSGGRVFIPARPDVAALSVLVLVAVLASRVAAARKRVERVLRTANRELDQRVNQRTEELERARESLQITLASIGDAVIATDTAGRITLLNGVAETLTGWTAAEAVGRPLEQVFAIVNADTRETVESPVVKVLRLGVQAGLANRTLLIGRHGREILIEDSGAPIRQANDEVVGVVLTFRDIGERYRMETERQRLLDSDERLVGILNNINDGFLTVDRQWRLTFLNRKASVFVQRPPDELMGTTLWDAMPKLAGSAAAAELERAMHDNVAVRCLINYDPRLAWFDTGAYPSGDGLALLMRDVTEHQRLEAQLRQAQKMEAVGRLAGGIAHDFNNLLTVINGYAEFALQELPTDLALCDNIKEILMAGRRAAELTNGLLAFSRKQVRMPAVLKLNDTVHSTEKMLRRLVGEDVPITTALAEDLWEIDGDRSQLEQIVVNLAANARDAMPRGGILTIETANTEIDEDTGQRLGVPAGAYAMLAVSDTGTGMDAETQARVFEPFFTTKGPGKGTGLGLATVYGIVKQSGGAISVYSEPGRGTTFKIYMPKRRDDAAPLVTETPEPALLVTRSRRRTILLVEDEDRVRRLTVTMLERHGFRVLPAASGREALEICQSEGNAIDLVLSDMVMPQMSGDKLAEELHRLYPGIQVLFMSGYSEHAVVDQALLSPEVNFISKPFTAATLLSKVNQALSGGAKSEGTAG
ncbi:MAG TPA: PAS domain-containing protein [Bryobacteraceae bacterium]|jgi:PAS domain S-box-containing protein|nr:PAS domain-containing protein [Bryobacteraceae bacterium]